MKSDIKENGSSLINKFSYQDIKTEKEPVEKTNNKTPMKENNDEEVFKKMNDEISGSPCQKVKFPLPWGEDKPMIEDEVNESNSTVGMCNRKVQQFENCSTTHTDMFISTTGGTGETINTYVTNKEKDSLYASEDKKNNYFEDHFDKNDFQPPVAAKLNEFQHPQSWTNVFEKYGSKELTQPSNKESPSKKDDAIYIPTKDSTPCFEAYSDKNVHGGKRGGNFDNFANYVERERKELDERVKRYLQDSSKGKVNSRPSGKRRYSEELPRGPYFDRMNKSMDAIRELSSSCSEDTLANKYDAVDFYKEYEDIHKSIDGKNLPQVKRVPPHVRNQRRLSGRLNHHRRLSVESMSSDDQVLIDYHGLSKPLSGLTTSLDRRILRYLKQKEEVTKEYTDATTASSTPVSSNPGSAPPPPISTTPGASSASSLGSSSPFPMEQTVKTSPMELLSPRGVVLTVPTEESGNESGNDIVLGGEGERVLPQNISEETAKIFLELLDFASDDSRGDEGNQYFEDVTYKFLKCLQVDAKGRKIEYKGGFLDAIKSAKSDIMAIERGRAEDLKSVITSTVMNANQNLETTFDDFDNRFESMRQRIIENFKCEPSQEKVSLNDVKELEDCLQTFTDDFDTMCEKNLVSLKNEELEKKLGTGDFEEQFRKFRVDLHHIQNIFVSSLKDGTGCVPNNTIDAVKVIFFEFDTNLENGRKKLIEGLKKTLQRITVQLYKHTSSFDKQCRSRLSSTHSESQQSDTADELTYFRGNIKDVNMLIINYFLSDQPMRNLAGTSNSSREERGSNLIKEIEELGYNVSLSDNNKLQVMESSTDVEARRPNEGVLVDEELSQSLAEAIVQDRERERDDILLMDVGKNDSGWRDDDVFINGVPSSHNVVGEVGNCDAKDMHIVMEVETPTLTEEHDEGDDKKVIEVSSGKAAEKTSDEEKCNDFDEAFFHVFDVSQETNTQKTTKSSVYVPVPYEPLVEDGVEIQLQTPDIPSKTDNKKNEYEAKKSFQVHLKCKSDSDDSQADVPKDNHVIGGMTTPFSSEESDFNQGYEQRNRCGEQLEQFDHVFEALRQNFLECLKSEQRAKSLRGAGRLGEDFREDFEVFNKLDADFDEIRQTFIESLRKDKNTAVDSIEESLCKFDDNFDEIRQKFLNSLRDDYKRPVIQDTTFTDLEASIDRFDDDFEELRQKFMDSLRKNAHGTDVIVTNAVNENEDDFENLRQKFMQSLKRDDVAAVENELNRTYTKISQEKLNTTYTKASEPLKSQNSDPIEEKKSEITEMKNESYVSPCLSKTVSSTDGQSQKEIPIAAKKPDQQSRDEVSWLDLNALGQFGPEEFSAGDSRCILPSCGEIVILQEPKGMPQFTKYSYSPQHIKKLKSEKPQTNKKITGKSHTTGKMGQKCQSKIKTKLKSRGKFMSDVHIVTDEPKHVEPTGPANRSWLDLNAIGQLGPEEEISGDNQFLLPTGKEVIILGEGGKITDSDHLTQLSNLRRKSSGKCNEFRRRGSKEKDTEVQQRKVSATSLKDLVPGEDSNDRADIITPPPRTTSLKRSELCTDVHADGDNSKITQEETYQHDDESRSVMTPYDLPEEMESGVPKSGVPTFEEILSSIENAIGAKAEVMDDQQRTNIMESAPLVDGDVEKSVSQQPLPPVPSADNSFYMDIEEIFMEEAHGKSLTQQPMCTEDDDFEVIVTPTSRYNEKNVEVGKELPVINLVVESEISEKTDSLTVERIKERSGLWTEHSLEMNGRKVMPEIQHGNKSPIKANAGGDGDSKGAMCDEESDSTGFIHRATSYMKTFFKFSYSDNEKSDNEKAGNEDDLEGQELNQTPERVQPRQKRQKHIDMDATDNFIEDLPSLVSDKTDASEVGTTENSSLLRGPRKPGPEERYNTSEGDELYKEIPMVIERLDMPKRKLSAHASEKEMSECSEELKGNKTNGVDLDATENLIDDIYLVTDEPDSSEAKSLPTASSRASNKVDRHYSTDERRCLGNKNNESDIRFFNKESIHDPAVEEKSAQEICERNSIETQEHSNIFIPQGDLKQHEVYEKDENSSNVQEIIPATDEEQGIKDQKITENGTGDDPISDNQRPLDPRFQGIPKSKHIGPEEVCSVEDKSLLALDKDIFVQKEERCEEKEKFVIPEEIIPSYPSNSDSGATDNTGNLVRTADGELQLNEATSFKPGPEEWISSKDVVVSSDVETSDNDGKTESAKEPSDDSGKTFTKLSTETHNFREFESGGEKLLKDRSDSSNGTYDIVSNREVQDGSADIRQAKKILYSPTRCSGSRDSTKGSPNKTFTPASESLLEPIHFDVVVEHHKKQDGNEKEQFMSESCTKDYSGYQVDGLEELKMLHLKTYSGTEGSGNECGEQTEGPVIRHTFTPVKQQVNETCTIINSADEDGSISKLFASTQFTQAMKNQTQSKRPPTGKRKRKLRRPLSSALEHHHGKNAGENVSSKQPLDLQVSLTRGSSIDANKSNKEQNTKIEKSKLNTNKRKEWKLDFGGNIRPSPLIKDRNSQKGFENLMFGLPDSPGRKAMGKQTSKAEGITAKMKKKLMTQYSGAVRERMNGKEKKHRALKVINLTVDKEQEFKKLTKAIKKKLILKKTGEKQQSNMKPSLKLNKDCNIKRKSSSKKEDKSHLPLIVKKGSLSENEKEKKRRNSSGKFSTSSSEDISAMSHTSRLESESNKRKEKPQIKGRKNSSTDNILITDEGIKSHVLHDEVLSRRTIELSVNHDNSAPRNNDISNNNNNNKNNDNDNDNESKTKGRRKVRRADKNNQDLEIDTLMSSMLTSSFRSRAANKLSSPESNGHTDSRDKLDEIEYDIDWEILKRGVKDHDSSSSYFTAEEVSKPSSSESSGSTPRDVTEAPTIKMIPDSCSEVHEAATSPEILSDCNMGKLFFAESFPSSSCASQVQSQQESAEESVDLLFSWENRGLRSTKQQHQQNQPSLILVDRSSSDRDSGITSSGEETSKSQQLLENHLKQNFLERSIYKLQSISEEDKLPDDDAVTGQQKIMSSLNSDDNDYLEKRLTVGLEVYNGISGEESMEQGIISATSGLKKDFLSLAGPEQYNKMTSDTPFQRNTPSEELNFKETIAFLQRSPLPIECMPSLDIQNLKTNGHVQNKQVSITDGINFSGELITFECDEGDEGEDDMKLNSELEKELTCLEQVGVYEDKNNISENLPFYLKKNLNNDDENAILKEKLDQFFADTCMKPDYLNTEETKNSPKTTTPLTHPHVNDEEFHAEFERLREFERLEEAFQEGKISRDVSMPRSESRLLPLKSEDECTESNLSAEVISVSTDVTGESVTSEAFYPRAPMTPITEESASSIEDPKGSAENKKAKDDNLQLFKPSKVCGDMVVGVGHKSPIKKKTTKSPKRTKKQKKGAKRESEGFEVPVVGRLDGGKVNKRYGGTRNKVDKVKTNKAAKLRKSVQLVKSNSNTSTNSEQEHYYDRFKMKTPKSHLNQLSVNKARKSESRVAHSDDLGSATDNTVVDHTDIDVELVVDETGDKNGIHHGVPDRVADDLEIPVHPEFEMIPTKERVNDVIKKVDNCVFSSPITDNSRFRCAAHAPFDTDGLEMIVTDISTNNDEKDDIALRRRKSSSSASVKKHLEEEKVKEQEVNRKVMKVIKLFTEAINKKEVEEGVTSSPDNCFSQQIMNSIFNAAQQSAYFEEESTADIIKALETDETCRELQTRMEMEDDFEPLDVVHDIGTAVQQYKHSATTISSKQTRTTPSPRHADTSHSSKVRPASGGHVGQRVGSTQSCSNEMRQSRGKTKTPITYNVNYLRRKFEDSDGSSDQGTGAAKGGTLVPRKCVKNQKICEVKKPNVNSNNIDNNDRNEQRTKTMKNTSSRKPARGEYISPYRQKLKKNTKIPLPQQLQQQQQQQQQQQIGEEQETSKTTYC